MVYTLRSMFISLIYLFFFFFKWTSVILVFRFDQRFWYNDAFIVYSIVHETLYISNKCKQCSRLKTEILLRYHFIRFASIVYHSAQPLCSCCYCRPSCRRRRRRRWQQEQDGRTDNRMYVHKLSQTPARGLNQRSVVEAIVVISKLYRPVLIDRIREKLVALVIDWLIDWLALPVYASRDDGNMYVNTMRRTSVSVVKYNYLIFRYKFSKCFIVKITS